MKNQLTGFQLLTIAFKVLLCKAKPSCSLIRATRFGQTVSGNGICIIFGFNVFLQILTIPHGTKLFLSIIPYFSGHI